MTALLSTYHRPAGGASWRGSEAARAPVPMLARWIVALSSVGEELADGQRELVRELLADLQRRGSEIVEHELGVLARRLAGCDAAIERLRTMPSSNSLVDHACEEVVRRCDFGRAVLSRVDGVTWRPWMAYFVDEQGSWFGEWVDRAIPLDDLVLESRLLTDHRPAAVYDTMAANVHRPIIVEAGHSDSYVVAPLVVADTVIGFLHADHHPTGRRVDVGDRDVLWAFAQRFAQLYERTVLAERLGEQREQLRRALASLDDALDDGCLDLTRPIDTWPATGARTLTVPTFGPGDAIEQLTVREREVLALVAVGATNIQVAARLAVSESTVKTHVKHILRKLGVANRAQAISEFLSDGPWDDAGIDQGASNSPSSQRPRRS